MGKEREKGEKGADKAMIFASVRIWRASTTLLCNRHYWNTINYHKYSEVTDLGYTMQTCSGLGHVCQKDLLIQSHSFPHVAVCFQAAALYWHIWGLLKVVCLLLDKLRISLGHFVTMQIYSITLLSATLCMFLWLQIDKLDICIQICNIRTLRSGKCLNGLDSHLYNNVSLCRVTWQENGQGKLVNKPLI